MGDRRLHITGDRVVDQINTLVPQQHLTLVSVLQGIALVALITSFKAPLALSPKAVYFALVAHNGYLPALASLLYLVAIWNEYMYGVFIGHWPLQSRWIFLQFLVTLAEIAAFSLVDSVGAWAFWMGVVALLGFEIRRGNRKRMAQSLFQGVVAGKAVDLHDQIVQRRERGVWSFLLIGVLFVFTGALRAAGLVYLSGSAQLPLGQHVVIYDVVLPSIAIIFAILTLRIDDRQFRYATELLLATYQIPYRMGEHGIELRPDPPMPTTPEERELDADIRPKGSELLS